MSQSSVKYITTLHHFPIWLVTAVDVKTDISRRRKSGTAHRGAAVPSAITTRRRKQSVAGRNRLGFTRRSHSARAQSKMKNVLVVDDDAAVRQVLVDFVEANGYRAKGVEDGRKALRVVKTLKPQIILLDILIPGMSGIETLRRLRHEAPETAVIMISAQTDHDVAVQALDLGAYDYIVKPLDYEYLKWVLLTKMALSPEPRDKR